MVQSRAEILRAIISSTEEHFDFPDISLSNVNNSGSNIDIYPLRLNTAIARFTDQLSAHNIPSKIADAALSRVSQLSDIYLTAYSTSCAKLLSMGGIVDGPSAMDNISNLRRTLENLFEQRDLPIFVERALKALAPSTFTRSTSQAVASIGGRERKPFNTQFTPYLEAYLEQNAFPSHADQKALAEKGSMDREQIITWFQNHRSRARKEGRESALKRLSPGQSVNTELIEAKIKLLAHDSAVISDDDFVADADSDDDSFFEGVCLNLDQLASSSVESIQNVHESKTTQPCVASSQAFDLPGPSKSRSLGHVRPLLQADDLNKLFGGFNIRTSNPSASDLGKSKTSKSKAGPSRASTPKSVTSSTTPFKATLRSCFTAAITLTYPSVHPALIRKKKNTKSTPLSNSRTTVLEQKRVPVQPYTLPAVLPTWELPAIAEPVPVIRRKKPTIASHAGRTRPGSPYPKQTISRMSSTSSLASMASDDSQSSSLSTSSDFSTSTVESSELDTPAQSPCPDNAELIDDIRFSDDIFGDYFFHTNPISENFFFDVNVEQPFDKDVSLSVTEFDKSISLSIAEFEATTLPSFDFFES